MRQHTIGVAGSSDLVDFSFYRSDLIVVPTSENHRLFFSDVVTMENAGWFRPGAKEGNGGTAVAWGPSEALGAIVKKLPDPVIVVVSKDPQPASGLLAKENIEWVQVEDTTKSKIQIQHHVGSSEIQLFDLTDED